MVSDPVAAAEWLAAELRVSSCFSAGRGNRKMQSWAEE